MKKSFLAFVTAVAMATQFGITAFAETPSTPSPGVEKEGWKLVFSDEFDGNTIHSEHWNAYDPNLASQDYYFYANSPETIVCPENDEGARIIQYKKLNADNQQWIFTPVTATE